MRAANEQTTYDTIVAQERAAMERWYTGDPSGYVELFVDDLTSLPRLVEGVWRASVP
jgi:hypothetical protein